MWGARGCTYGSSLYLKNQTPQLLNYYIILASFWLALRTLISFLGCFMNYKKEAKSLSKLLSPTPNPGRKAVNAKPRSRV